MGLGALAGGWLCRRFGIPEVLGYLAAGVALRPGALVDGAFVATLAQFAVLFRMFTLGLDFDSRRLRGQWRPALFAGGLEMGVCTLAGLGVASIFGWPLLEGAILGAALGTTSTNILTKALADRGLSSRPDARAAGAATLTEDLIAIGLLALLSVFSGAEGLGEVVTNAAWLLVFAALAFTAGAILLPLALDGLHRARSEELVTLAVLGTLFGFAALSEGLRAGRPVGAFLAGIVVGAARHAPGLTARVLPLRDVLTAIAYVSVGLLLDPRTILAVAPAAGLVALAFVPLKIVATAIGLRLGGVAAVTSARAGAILGQAGTMGLVLACTPFLAPEAAGRLMAFAFVAWALTVGLTPVRLRWGPAAAEAVARLLGASEQTPTAGRGWAPPLDADTRRDAFEAVLAAGCAVGVVALATLAVWPAAGELADPLALALAGLAGAAAAIVVLPFAAVAGVALRRALHRGAHELALAPARLARGRREGARTWAVAGTVAGIAGTFALCALVAVALAPSAERPALLAGALAGALVLALRPRWLERLMDHAAAVVGKRRFASARLQLAGYRGVQPFGVDVEGLVVREGTRASFAPVEGLGLAGSTGARVVAILRGAAREPAPLAPGAIVRPGDELVVAGTPAQLVAARRFLLEPPRA